jgi:hypothetical protein
VSLKFEKRRNKRLRCEADIRHDNLLPDIFYNAKLHNISQNGVYFESDQVIYPGEDIYIGLNDSTHPVQKSKDHIRVEIIWRKDLQNASFRFGYGAKLLNPIHRLAESIDRLNIRTTNKHVEVRIDNGDPRKHSRKPYSKVMFFASGNRTCKGRISNISRGGAYIITKDKFFLGQLIQLVIPGDKNRKDVKLKGWVVRLGPNGLGVRFDRRSGRDRRIVLDRRGNQISKKKKHSRK